MMIGENIHFIAQLSVERLLNGVLEGSVIALFAWLLLRLIGRRNSGTRFAVWFCALLAIAIAPFLEGSAAGRGAMLHPGAAITVPRVWSFYLFAAWAGIALFGLARVMVGLWHLRTIRRNCSPLLATGSGVMEAAPKGAEDQQVLTASLKRCPDTKLQASWPYTKLPTSRPEVNVREPWPNTKLLDLGADFVGPDSQTVASLSPPSQPSEAWVGQSSAEAEPSNDLELTQPSSAVARAIAESGRRIDLRVSEELRVPTAVGLWKPAVVIPAWALRELSAAELNAVVLHEVAHLRRWDDWTNLAQKLLRAVFFFHPAVWWVEGRLSLEREMACDDMVLAQTRNPRAYAECLVSLAEKNLLQRGIALAQAAVGRMAQTTARVIQILDPRRTTTSNVWKPAPWVVAGFSVLCLVSAGHAPRLIAFGDPAGDSPIATSSAAMSTAVAASEENSSFRPPVVPAAYHAAARAPRVVVHPTKASARRTFDRSSQPEPAVHQALHRVAPEPAIPLVHAAYAEDAPVVVMQQAVFVFVQDSPFVGATPVMWRVRIWNFTVLPAAPSQAGRELPSKSI